MSPSADPLALPAVPPPAPAMHPWRDRIVSLAFTIALALPGLMLLKTAHRTMTSFENRPAAPWPDASAGSAFMSRFEQAFADRFGGRDRLIEWHHATLVRLFETSPVQKAMLGSDGWIYFLGEDAHSLDRHYRGVLAFSDEQVMATVTELEHRSAYLQARGIAYVVTIVPDKFTIYPEHLPRWVRPSTTPTPLARIVDAIRARGRVRLVDLRGPLLEAKQASQVYFKTDSHWNLLGARIGAARLMGAVRDALPDRIATIHLTDLPPYVPGEDVYSGDLANMLGLPQRFAEPDLAPLGKLLADQDRRCARRIDGQEIADTEIYACDKPGLPRAVMFRDSMAIPLIPLISDNFSRIAYVSSRALDTALIDREKPDVVIEEMVERSVNAPAAFPIKP